MTTEQTDKKPVNDGPLVLVSYDSKEEAEVVAAYLVKELTMCHDSKLEVVQNPTPENERNYKSGKPHWHCREWMVQTPSGHDYWSTFKNTIEKIHNAASDFLAGYRQAAKTVKRNTDHEWVLSLPKSELNKLRTRKATENDIGLAIGEYMQKNFSYGDKWDSFQDPRNVQKELKARFIEASLDQINEVAVRMRI